MITFRPDTSFPYFAFARSRGLDYGEVLRVLDQYEATGKMPPPEWTMNDFVALLHTRNIENKRRKKEQTSNFSS